MAIYLYETVCDSWSVCPFYRQKIAARWRSTQTYITLPWKVKRLSPSSLWTQTAHVTYVFEAFEWPCMSCSKNNDKLQFFCSLALSLVCYLHVKLSRTSPSLSLECLPNVGVIRVFSGLYCGLSFLVTNLLLSIDNSLSWYHHIGNCAGWRFNFPDGYNTDKWSGDWIQKCSVIECGAILVTVLNTRQSLYD